MSTPTSTDSAGTWLAVEATDQERRRFADLAAVVHAAAEAPLAAPANRLRSVRRLDTAQGAYFLKEFQVTQPKNRLKFLATRPRARDDAAREGRMACALRAAGFAAPRVVGMGRAGAASYLLLAELSGESLRDSLTRQPTRSLAHAAARHCGKALVAGFDLPDLSLDHVFVARGETGSDTSDDTNAGFGLLDLHNGSLRPPGPPRGRTCVRIMRRFTKSARGMNLSRPAALGFAVRMLRSAGVPSARRRRILTKLPPWDTASRYETAGKSGAYRTRNPKRHATELRLLRRVWPDLAPDNPTRPGGSMVLDAPCGAGRLLPLLQELGHRVTQADGAHAMLREAREAASGKTHGAVGCIQGDARALPFADAAFAGCVVFRFLHHLPPNEAREAVREACRVAQRFVVMSFFHPVSAHAFHRSLKLRWSGRARTRFALRPKTLDAWFRAEGFRMAKCKAESRFLKDFWVASWVRHDDDR